MLKRLQMYYVLVSLPFVMLLAGAGIFRDSIKSTLDRNPHPQINYTIFIIIFFGGIIILLNSRRLVREARALKAFAQAIHAKIDKSGLRNLANSFTCDISNLLQMIAATSDRSISHQEQAALEHELANVHSRLNRRNALPQYLTGLLVGMGLLGTFIGLLATLGDIGALIGSFSDLDMSTADPIVVFSKMIEKMKAPMQSMAIAFSASMFGLLGSIILGLMMVGIRRVQGDIFSVLSSETARHIEIALSYESSTFRPVDGTLGGYDEAQELNGKILLRIEERLAESLRARQRALTAEIDEFKQQRGEMLQAMTAQTTASVSFQGDLQKLTDQLGAIFRHLEQGHGDTANQISELSVRLAGDARETHKLLAGQLETQNRLLSALDPANLEERLAESLRTQQRTLSAVVEDLKAQRTQMQRAVEGQTEATRESLGELRQIGEHLAAMAGNLERGQAEVSGQLSELTVHMGADAKEAHRLVVLACNKIRSELQQLGTLLAQGNDQVRGAQQQLGEGHGNVCTELQTLGKQLRTIFGTIEKGRGELSGQLAELMQLKSAQTAELEKATVSAVAGQ